MPYKDPATQREYARLWRNARRARWLAGKCCEWCGSTDNLEVDHKDPTKKVSHRIWSWSEVRRNEELAKCQVLCRSCHAIKTRQDSEPDHGNNSRYTSKRYKCRCDDCRLAHAEANIKY